MRKIFWIVFLLISFRFLFPVNYIKLSEVKRGMEGYGYTVYSGSSPERFGVKILGIVRDPAPGQNIIIARLTGKKAEKYGIFAGMSGSPVFIDGKLLGAVAYGFTFSAEPICGITPFENMLKIGKFERKNVVSVDVLNKIYREMINFNGTCDKFMGDICKSLLPEKKVMGDLYPIPIPIFLDGRDFFVKDGELEFLNYFNFVPVKKFVDTASKVNAPSQKGISELKPGDSVVASLCDGDFSLGAGGTVTFVNGNRFWAFGHPFMQMGSCEMNFYSSDVVTVLKNLNNSFKLFTMGKLIGKVLYDERMGVSGILGDGADMVPVKLVLKIDGKEVGNYSYNIMRNPIFTPFLYTLSIQNILSAYYKLYGDTTIRMNEEIGIEGEDSVHFENYLFGNMNVAKGLGEFMALPVYFLKLSGFQGVKLTNISAEIELFTDRKIAKIERLWINRREFFPGDEVKLHVDYLLNKEKRVKRDYTFYIPEDITPGNLNLYVGDGGNLMKLDSEIEPDINTISTLSQLIKLLNDVKENNKLYIKLYRKSSGVMIGDKPLMDMPYSYYNLLTSGKTLSNISKIKNIHYVESNFDPEGFLIQGYKIFKLKIKNPDEVK